MFNTTQIDYSTAKLLCPTRDVIVFEPATGDVCRFDDPQWCHYGIKKDFYAIQEEIGIGGIELGYVFFFVVNSKSLE